MIAFNGDDGDTGFLQWRQYVCGLAKHWRRNLRRVKEIACDEEGVGFPFDRSRDDVAQRHGKVRVGQAAIQSAAAEVQIGTVNDAH